MTSRQGAGPPAAAARYHVFIQARGDQGLSARRIRQELWEERGYSHGLPQRAALRGRLKRQRPDVADVLEHPPGGGAR